MDEITRDQARGYIMQNLLEIAHRAALTELSCARDCLVEGEGEPLVFLVDGTTAAVDTFRAEVAAFAPSFAEVQVRRARPVCFCDGNGYVPCDECEGEGIVGPFCGDDLCTGNECFHDMPKHVCGVCKGSGILLCPAHE